MKPSPGSSAEVGGKTGGSWLQRLRIDEIVQGRPDLAGDAIRREVEQDIAAQVVLQHAFDQAGAEALLRRLRHDDGRSARLGPVELKARYPVLEIGRPVDANPAAVF